MYGADAQQINHSLDALNDIEQLILKGAGCVASSNGSSRALSVVDVSLLNQGEPGGNTVLLLNDDGFALSDLPTSFGAVAFASRPPDPSPMLIAQVAPSGIELLQVDFDPVEVDSAIAQVRGRNLVPGSLIRMAIGEIDGDRSPDLVSFTQVFDFEPGVRVPLLHIALGMAPQGQRLSGMLNFEAERDLGAPFLSVADFDCDAADDILVGELFPIFDEGWTIPANPVTRVRVFDMSPLF